MLTGEIVESGGGERAVLEPVPQIPPISIDDCVYELAEFKCPECGDTHYRVARFSGAFSSVYIPPPGFAPAAFASFCRDLHRNLHLDPRAILAETSELIDRYHTPSGLVSDGSYLNQLIDFARMRMQQLGRLGLLAPLARGQADSESQLAALAGFELGYAASELRLKDAYEDVIFEGSRLQEGREAGREAAAQAKRRTTARTRDAICKAARSLYADDPSLARNDAATSRAIEGMHLPALCRGGSVSIGHDAIAKHLRALHQLRAL